MPARLASAAAASLRVGLRPSPRTRAGLGLLALALAGGLVAQNSTQKIRPRPGEAAARAGSAVQWRANLAAAREESLASKKPLFWYVPTVPGSPMDRKREVDGYMMAGPFSWPPIVALLNERFVPVKAAPKADVAKEFGLARGKFIEPGFLVVNDGKETARCSQLTTFMPDWWMTRLHEALGETWRRDGAKSWHAGVEAYTRGDFAAAAEAFAAMAEDRRDDPAAMGLYLQGVALRRQRQLASAEQAWDRLLARAPKHMLAFKVAAEREGHGPLLRSFEDHQTLPAAVLAGAKDTTQAPGGVYTRDELIARSVRFLLEQQGEDGLYRDSWYDFGGTDSLPNVHMAVTALVGWALQMHRGAVPQTQQGALAAALLRVENCAKDEARIAGDDRDEIVWAHAYRLRMLSRWMMDSEDARSRLFTKASALVGALAGLQEDSGAWFHEYPNPFVIATVLLALHEAKQAGVEVPEDTAARGAQALLQCRAKNGAFPYGFARKPPNNVNPIGAAGRMPLCELALLRWGKSDQDKLAAALRAAFEHHDVLAAVRKYDDHADQHGYGGFFFWYDLRARSEAIAALTDAKLRAELQAKQDALVLALPEIDGVFVDSHELGRCYGTAMALLCLGTR
jgi:hypothetical protein